MKNLVENDSNEVTKMNRELGFSTRSGCAKLVLLVCIIAAGIFVVPSLALATGWGAQPPVNSQYYQLGQTPVPNAGMRSHWDSVMTGPGWWRNRGYNQTGPQGPMQYPTVPVSPYQR